MINIRSLVFIFLVTFLTTVIQAQYDKNDYNFRRLVKNDRSLWPDMKNKNGKPKIPVRIERENVIFSNQSGFPTFGYLTFDKFLNYVLGYMKKLTDFEQHITYKNIGFYHDYFPENIVVRMTHYPFQDDKKLPAKYRSIRLKAGEILFFSKIDNDGVVYLTNKKIQSRGVSDIPLDLYYTNLLYETRRIVRRELNEASAEYLHPLILKNYNKHTLTVYEVNKDLTEQKASLNSHTDKLTSFTRHTRRPVDSMNAVFPLPIEIKTSEWEGFIDKVRFKSNFHFFSQTYSVSPDNPMEGIFVMKFLGDKWKRQSMGWIEQPIPHDWENFVDFTEDWEIIDYQSNVKGSFTKKPGNVLYFSANDVIETPHVIVRLKRAHSIKETTEASDTDKRTPKVKVEKISKVTTLKDLDNGFVRSYKTNDSSMPFKIWDGLREDGDLITVILNGTPIFEKVQVVNEKQSLNFKLLKGENILEIRAENQGLYVPNTAMFQYGTDILELQSRTGQSKKMKIYYEE